MQLFRAMSFANFSCSLKQERKDCANGYFNVLIVATKFQELLSLSVSRVSIYSRHVWRKGCLPVHGFLFSKIAPQSVDVFVEFHVSIYFT